VQTDGVARAGLATARLDGAGTRDYPNVKSLANRFTETLIAAPEKVQALLVAEANPCYSQPNAGALREAMAEIPFVVSFSSFMDETTMMADLVLPNHVYLERLEDVPVTAGLVQSIVGLSQPVAEPQFDTRHLGDTLIAIARALKGSVAAAFPWDDYETCLQSTMEYAWETLKEKGYVALEPQPAATRFSFFDNNQGAVYLADAVGVEGDPGLLSMQLIPYDSIRLASDRVGEPPFMLKTVADNVLKGQDGFVEVNAQTAEKMGLEEGQRVYVITAKGQAIVRVHRSQGIAPEVIAMARGLGHTAYDGYLARKGTNVNELIGAVEDPASGLDAAYAIRAKLAKA
jgi:anaerobic selenocysteine-containing dehydrogenase